MIFVLWTGTNEMSPARKKGLESIRLHNDNVVLVNKDNISDYITEPLHPGYKYLSDVHKSDYLRCYLMHFHGGGYMDVKYCERSWLPVINTFSTSDKMACGYREVSPNHVAPCDNSATQRLLAANYKKLIGMGAFIFKKQTAITSDWYYKVIDKMNEKYEALEQTPGNIRGDNAGYPLRWTELLGDILHPLCLKYGQYIMHDDRIKPNFNKQYI